MSWCQKLGGITNGHDTFPGNHLRMGCHSRIMKGRGGARRSSMARVMCAGIRSYGGKEEGLEIAFMVVHSCMFSARNGSIHPSATIIIQSDTQ